MVTIVLWRCRYIWLLNVMMVFEFLMLTEIKFHSFAPDTETAFCPELFFDNHICTHKSRFYLFSDTLFQRSKLIFSTFHSVKTYRFIYVKDASFSRKILLKLSITSLVTVEWRGIVLMLVIFAAKLIHYCTSYCIFLLHLPHIELE